MCSFSYHLSFQEKCQNIKHTFSGYYKNQPKMYKVVTLYYKRAGRAVGKSSGLTLGYRDLKHRSSSFPAVSDCQSRNPYSVSRGSEVTSTDDFEGVAVYLSYATLLWISKYYSTKLQIYLVVNLTYQEMRFERGLYRQNNCSFCLDICPNNFHHSKPSSPKQLPTQVRNKSLV